MKNILEQVRALIAAYAQAVEALRDLGACNDAECQVAHCNHALSTAEAFKELLNAGEK